jgi:hypothetical protein
MAANPGTITVVCKDLPEVKARLEALERQRDVLAEWMRDMIGYFAAHRISLDVVGPVLAEIASEKKGGKTNEHTPDEEAPAENGETDG